MFFLLLFTNLYDSFTDKRAKDFSRRVEQFEEKQGMYVVPLSYRSCYIWSSRCSIIDDKVKLQNTHLRVL